MSEQVCGYPPQSVQRASEDVAASNPGSTALCCPCPCCWEDTSWESGFGDLEVLSLVRSSPNASGTTGWRMNAGIHKGAGSMEKNTKQKYTSVIKWALFGPGREQGTPTWHTLEKWLHVMLPSTNKSPDDQISKSKVQRL